MGQLGNRPALDDLRKIAFQILFFIYIGTKTDRFRHETGSTVPLFLGGLPAIFSHIEVLDGFRSVGEYLVIAATLPLNKETCINELGCSEEISSFVLPTGMTINMNGTTAMHMIAITFIATAAGVNITPATLCLTAFLSICTAVGTPAIPVAGTTMVYVVMMGLGLNSDLCMIGYSLILAMNYLPGMAVITLNVIGDAATNVIVCAKEHCLNKEIYNSKTPKNN